MLVLDHRVEWGKFLLILSSVIFVVLFSEKKLKLFFETCDLDSSGALNASEIGEVIKVGWHGYTYLECMWACA